VVVDGFSSLRFLEIKEFYLEDIFSGIFILDRILFEGD
jgi:hypothetical protein